MSYKIGSVSGNRLEDGSVGTDALATDAVTNAKMADSAIGSAEIVDASIVGGDLAADIGLDLADAPVRKIGMADQHAG